MGDLVGLEIGFSLVFNVGKILNLCQLQQGQIVCIINIVIVDLVIAGTGLSNNDIQNSAILDQLYLFQFGLITLTHQQLTTTIATYSSLIALSVIFFNDVVKHALTELQLRSLFHHKDDLHCRDNNKKEQCW